MSTSIYYKELSNKMSFSVPVGAVAGEPDVGDEVSFEEALVFAADLVGGLKYLMPPAQREVVFN
jgi:hypothetical protein